MTIFEVKPLTDEPVGSPQLPPGYWKDLERCANVEFIRAQVEGQKIDNRTADALATTATISAEREINTVKWEQASNSRNREYHFTDQVGPDSVSAAVDTFSRWDRLDSQSEEAGETPKRSYKFVICSAGGSVVHGMKLYSTLKAIAGKRDLTTVASGICASMATVLHQTGTRRIIEPGCSYLIHDVSGDSGGSLGQMQDAMEWMNALNAELHKALAEKSNMTVEEVAALGKRRDAWFMPTQVVEMGLADEIGYAIH